MDNYDREFGDNLCSKDKRLTRKWKWTRVASRISEEDIKKWTHFQCSEAKVGVWGLEALQWGSGEKVRYEASIMYLGNQIASQEGFPTRLDAQIGAEKLLIHWINKQKKLINKKVGE